MSIKSMMPSNHLILCRPLLLPSVFPSIRVFSNESAVRIRWSKYWSFSFNIGPSNEHPGLISFRMDLVGSPCSPRDSQESYPTPKFKSIDSSVLSCFCFFLTLQYCIGFAIYQHESATGFFHSPTLTSIHDHRKNHSLD